MNKEREINLKYPKCLALSEKSRRTNQYGSDEVKIHALISKLATQKRWSNV